ncbi:MAG: AI-2E family transporter [Actinomycetota bacterium]|nr:AI-2E family transporter [Actinomycetota bacterium]
MAAHERPTNATIARVVLVTAGVLLVLYAAYLVRSILLLVFVAAFLAVGLDPAVRRLERFGVKRGVAVAIIFLVTIAFIVGFFYAVIPPLVQQVTRFAADLPGYVEDLSKNNARIREWVIENDIPDKLKDATKNVPTVIGASLGGVLGIAGSVVSTIFSGLTVLILTIYFLLSLSRIRTGGLRLVPQSKRERVRTLADPILEKVGGYIAGQITVALIAGVLAFAFLAIADVPFPVALALWVAIAAIIPLVGATLGAVPAVVVAFFTSPGLGFATLVYFLVYQQVENYVIAPRVMTRAVDVSPAAVLLAALVGASLLGFVGALVAIPAAASLKLIAQEVWIPRAETT